MDDHDALLIAGLVIGALLVAVIIVFFTCWYIKRRRRTDETRQRLIEDVPIISKIREQPKKRAKEQADAALLTCHFYIRVSGEYTFNSQLSQVGFNPEKSWFLLTPISRSSVLSMSSTSHILTIQPKSPRLKNLTDEDSTAIYARTLNNLVSRLFHPYVEPIIKIDILHTQQLVLTVKQYQRLGSLKDVLHGAMPTASFHVFNFLILFLFFILILNFLYLG